MLHRVRVPRAKDTSSVREYSHRISIDGRLLNDRTNLLETAIPLYPRSVPVKNKDSRRKFLLSSLAIATSSGERGSLVNKTQG